MAHLGLPILQTKRMEIVQGSIDQAHLNLNIHIYIDITYNDI